MKARLLAPGKVKNPLYVHRQHRLALRDGKPYPYTPEIEVEAGYLFNDPDCWIHCCPGLFNADPIAEPADDECRERVLAFMTSARPAQLANLRSIYENIGSIKDPDQRKHIQRQAEAYGIAKGASDKFADGLPFQKQTSDSAS